VRTGNNLARHGISAFLIEQQLPATEAITTGFFHHSRLFSTPRRLAIPVNGRYYQKGRFPRHLADWLQV
jgi:hypothetical protein